MQTNVPMLDLTFSTPISLDGIRATKVLKRPAFYYLLTGNKKKEYAVMCYGGRTPLGIETGEGVKTFVDDCGRYCLMQDGYGGSWTLQASKYLRFLAMQYSDTVSVIETYKNPEMKSYMPIEKRYFQCETHRPFAYIVRLHSPAE